MKSPVFERNPSKSDETELNCDPCGPVIRKSELEVRGNLNLCIDCAVVHDIDGENVEA